MTSPRSSTAGAVVLEEGKRRVFASALDWPGWCRSGRDAESALAALAAAAVRYAPVAQAAGLTFPEDAGDRLVVTERLPGDATTDFGAPSAVATEEWRPVGADEARHRAALLRASWDLLARTARSAPAQLRKGPRGGGRDRDDVVRHVREAEFAYARKVGVRFRRSDDPEESDLLRSELLAVLGGPSPGGEPGERGWPHRYAVRRLSWHVLDHAWEIQDRSGVEPAG